MDVSKMPVAKMPSDENDGVALFVYPMGNGDWYAAIGSDERDHPGFGDQIRFCTSGTRLGDAPMVMALLYRVATEQWDDAAATAESLARILKERASR